MVAFPVVFRRGSGCVKGSLDSETCFSLLGSSRCPKMQCSLRRGLWKILFQKSVFLATKCKRLSFALDGKVDPFVKLTMLWAWLRIPGRNRQTLWRLLFFQVTSATACTATPHAVLPKCSFSVIFHALRWSITDQKWPFWVYKMFFSGVNTQRQNIKFFPLWNDTAQ